MAVLGCIADDFTGATDLANTLTREGMATVQINGLPEGAAPEADALVVALKSRSIEPAAAVEQSLAALAWLRAANCRKFFFKYCSTFDSTPAGNIGPVAEALLDALASDVTIACPAAPENGRTVYRGHLFVGDQLLSETGMRQHPVTPMTDSNLVRVLQAQSKGRVRLIPFDAVEAGPEAITQALDRVREEGSALAIADAVSEAHLRALAAGTWDLPLITGGSGLALGLPALFEAEGQLERRSEPLHAETSGAALVLSGSCSQATNRQVQVMAERCPALRLDARELARDEAALDQVVAWAQAKLAAGPILIYSTSPPDQVAAVQATLGPERACGLLEAAMGELALRLVEDGVGRLVVAGGETAGAVVSALGVRRLAIGREIAPGVPWTYSLDRPGLALALKSGNFGQPDFFLRAFGDLR